MQSEIQTLSKLLSEIEALRASYPMPDRVMDHLTQAATEVFETVMALQPDGARDIAAMLCAVAAFNNDDEAFNPAMLDAIDTCRAGAERVALSF